VDYGKRIKEERKKVGMTQKKLAELAHIAVITLQQYEAGKRQPRLEQLQSISKALGVHLYVLLGGDEDGIVLYKEEMDELIDYETSEFLQTKLDNAFCLLNEAGKRTAVDRIEELVKIPDYRRKESADSEDND